MIFYIILIVVSIVALILVNCWEKRCKEEISAKVTVDLDLPGVIEDYNRLLKKPDPPKPPEPEPEPTWFETTISPKLKEIRRYAKKLFGNVKFSVIEINIGDDE